MVYIYSLKLQSDKYYIGKTDNPNFRLENHFGSSGSAWTKKYTPISIHQVIPDMNSHDEQRVTQEYIAKYGIDNVRGGPWVKVILSDTEKVFIQNLINGETDKCFKCGSGDHFANSCNKSAPKVSNVSKVTKVSKVPFKEQGNAAFESNKYERAIQLYTRALAESTNPQKYTIYSNRSAAYLKIGKCSAALKDAETCITLKDDFARGWLRKGQAHEVMFQWRDAVEAYRFGLKIDPTNTVLKQAHQNASANVKVKPAKVKNCKRCMRNGHSQDNCYAKTYANGRQIEEEYDDDDIWQCEFCKKEFDSEKGCRFHENVHCSKRRTGLTNKPRTYTGAKLLQEELYESSDDDDVICYNCGRPGHKSNTCYAQKHKKGYWS